MQTLNFSSGCHFIRSSQMVGAGLGTGVIIVTTGDSDGESIGEDVGFAVGLQTSI